MSRAIFNRKMSWFATVAAIARANPSQVFSCYVLNKNAAARYLQVTDQAIAIASGYVLTIDDLEFEVPAGAGGVVIADAFFTADGTNFLRGVSWGMSTTSGSYTAATAADHNVTLLVNQ